ncbi:MAG TPA: 23S rRNA (pseudouridine(1915)-N(3))-methyltransferase RlmH [Flavitalea sp.]|nr:23S rRNA (pseudouridine(1915)-N(3))-methyltransferase RlmH [Flavitalea sp.]
MKVILTALGKPHDPTIKSAIDDYSNRIANYFDINWNIIPSPKNLSHLSMPEIKKKEGEAILKSIQKEDFLVALDENGKQFNSLLFAKFLQDKTNAGVRNMVFVIGGAFGLDDEIVKRANHNLSLSSFTFPHQLVRLILAEQIYRAATILRNEKYHHS